MASKPFHIRSNDRVGIFGKTGSGKTKAALKLLWESFGSCIFYDGKRDGATGDLELGVPVLESIDELEAALFAEDPDDRLDRIHYLPANPNVDDWDAVCRLAYERGDVHLIGDELKRVYQEGNSVRAITDAHNDVLVSGRSRGVGHTAISQRPKRIPMECISEAEHILAFRLRIGDDRKRIQQAVGDKGDVTRQLDGYRYLYDHPQLDEPKVCPALDL